MSCRSELLSPFARTAGSIYETLESESSEARLSKTQIYVEANETLFDLNLGLLEERFIRQLVDYSCLAAYADCDRYATDFPRTKAIWRKHTNLTLQDLPNKTFGTACHTLLTDTYRHTKISADTFNRGLGLVQWVDPSARICLGDH